MERRTPTYYTAPFYLRFLLGFLPNSAKPVLPFFFLGADFVGLPLRMLLPFFFLATIRIAPVSHEQRMESTSSLTRPSSLPSRSQSRAIHKYLGMDIRDSWA